MAKTPKITAANRKAADKLNMVIEIDRDSLEFVLGFHEDGQLTEEAARDADFSTAYAKAQAFVRPTAEDAGFSDSAHAMVPDHQPDPPAEDEVVHEADPIDRRSDADVHDGPAEHPTSDTPTAVELSPKIEMETPAIDELVAAKPKPKPGTIVAKSYKVLYGDTQSCGDLFSVLISDLVQKPKAKGKGTMTDEQSLFALAEQNDVDMVALWPTANVGQRRMNLSNVLRGRARRGLETWIGQHRFCLAETEAANPELHVADIARKLDLLQGVDGGKKWLAALAVLRERRLKAEAKEGSSKPQPEQGADLQEDATT